MQSAGARYFTLKFSECVEAVRGASTEALAQAEALKDLLWRLSEGGTVQRTLGGCRWRQIKTFCL